jgi:hypothetical protein
LHPRLETPFGPVRSSLLNKFCEYPLGIPFYKHARNSDSTFDFEGDGDEVQEVQALQQSFDLADTLYRGQGNTSRCLDGALHKRSLPTEGRSKLLQLGLNHPEVLVQRLGFETSIHRTA